MENVKRILFSLSEFAGCCVEKAFKDIEIDGIGFQHLMSICVKANKISDSQIYLCGKIEGYVVLECSRCLLEFKHNLNIQINTDLFFENSIVDVVSEIRQLVILEIPQKPLCGHDCLGICEVCGIINKRNDICACKENYDEFAKARWYELFNASKNNRRK
ncbi:MAG: hypothetical protein LBU55_01675 [Elusimicrobiota bacterium]|jgi:uncharacterized protein|nr:hypothetical protein [Elusimicrobiota bacterium]